MASDQRVLVFRRRRAPMNEDPLLELRAGAEQAQFQILLVSEFDRIGRVPVECSAAAAFLSDMVLRYGL